MARPYKCRRCGKVGHGRSACPNSPETDGTYDRARPLLGTLPDAEVAATVGTSTQTVASWRRRLGIQKAPRRADPEVKYPGITHRLGSDTDSVIAAEYNLSRERVRQIRNLLGIRKADTSRPVPPEWIESLGRVSDGHIARATGIPVWCVRRERVAAGIPAAVLATQYDQAISRVHDRVGKVSDRALAAELGIRAAQVATYRRRHGIPPFALSPKSPNFVPLDRGRVAYMFHAGFTDDEIADELGTTSHYVRHVRSNLELRREYVPQPHVPQDVVDEIRRRFAAGEVRWRIAEGLGVNPSTVYRITRSDAK